jgi:hypothetical protein
MLKFDGKEGGPGLGSGASGAESSSATASTLEAAGRGSDFSFSAGGGSTLRASGRMNVDDGATPESAGCAPRAGGLAAGIPLMLTKK